MFIIDTLHRIYQVCLTECYTSSLILLHYVCALTWILDRVMSVAVPALTDKLIRLISSTCLDESKAKTYNIKRQMVI